MGLKRNFKLRHYHERQLLDVAEIAANDLRFVIFDSRRCSKAISRELLSHTTPNSDEISAPIWRRERGKFSFTKAAILPVYPSLHRQSGAARLKTRQSFEAILNNLAIWDLSSSRSSTLATCAARSIIQQRKRIGAPCQPMLRRTVPRQRDQVSPVLS